MRPAHVAAPDEKAVLRQAAPHALVEAAKSPSDEPFAILLGSEKVTADLCRAVAEIQSRWKSGGLSSRALWIGDSATKTSCNAVDGVLDPVDVARMGLVSADAGWWLVLIDESRTIRLVGSAKHHELAKLGSAGGRRKPVQPRREQQFYRLVIAGTETGSKPALRVDADLQALEPPGNSLPVADATGARLSVVG